MTAGVLQQGDQRRLEAADETESVQRCDLSSSDELEGQRHRLTIEFQKFRDHGLQLV